MSEALHMPHTLAGRYRLERELGHGAMGYVYLARDLKHGREVAVKVLAPHATQALDAERFLAEVHTAAGLNHPHILPLHDSGEEEGRLYYVMPRVEGSSLRDRLDRERRLPLAEAVEIACQVGQGLAYIHARGLVHRDIKPGNILIDASGHSYIADFGLTLALSSFSSVRRTASGVALGSPLYMSPEQAAGEADVDARSDVYSLGCVLFEMLAGSPPFQARQVRQVLNLHITAPPPSLRSRRADVPLALDRIVRKALEKDPDARFATATMFTDVLGRDVLPAIDSGSRERARLRPGVGTEPDAEAESEAVEEWEGGTRVGWATAFARLGKRTPLRWLAAYLVTGWVLLQAAEAAATTFSWPAAVVRIALVLFAAGAVALVAIPWLSRARGRRGGRGPNAWALTAASVGAILAAGAIVAAGWDSAPRWGDGPGGTGFNPDGAGIAPDFEVADGALAPNRIAVLYFDDRSPDGDIDHLAAGFTESLIDALTAVPGLEVLSKHAVTPYRAQAVALDEIVSTLEVGTLVSGTVHHEDGRLLVSIQLVDGDTGAQLWSTSFERPSGALLEVRNRLVDELARALRARLGYEFQVRRSRQDATNDRAWHLVRQADELIGRDNTSPLALDDTEAAGRFLRRADSLYAAAAALDSAWLAPTLRRAEVAEIESHVYRPAPDKRSPEHLRRGIGFAEDAHQRDSGYAPALEMRGRLRYHLAESTSGAESGSLLTAAAADLQRAVEIQPSLAVGWWHLSRVYTRQGWFAEAAAAAERAYEADAFLELPQNIIFQLWDTALKRERLDEAIRWCRLGTHQYPSAPHFALCRLYLLASVDTLSPDIDRGWALADSMALLSSDDRREDFQTLGPIQVAKIAARAGLPDSARSVLQRVAAAHGGIPDFAAYDAAHLRVMLGERERALPLLRRYIEYRGPQRAASLATDWWFRPLWGDPDFEVITGHAGTER